MKNIKRHAPGVYFDLDEDEYHADDALGSTDIKLLAHKPWEWQRQRLRGRDGTKITEPMKFGKAFHCYVLEGKDVFEERYSIKPEPTKFGTPGEDVLVTTDHLKEFLKAKNVKTTGNKPDLIARALELPDCPVIYDHILQRFEEKVRADKEYLLTAYQLQEVLDGVHQMKQDPITSQVMSAHEMMGGKGEISVFYKHNGVRCKNRYDYPLPSSEERDYAMILDLKVFSNFRGGDPEQAAMDTIFRQGHDIQTVHYLRGFEKAKKLVEQDQVFGDEPFPGFIERLFGAPNVRWAWIMLKRDEGFVPIIPWVQRDDAYWRDQFWSSTEAAVNSAFENYREYHASFGDDQLWAPPGKMPPRVSYDLLPSYNRGF